MIILQVTKKIPMKNPDEGIKGPSLLDELLQSRSITREILDFLSDKEIVEYTILPDLNKNSINTAEFLNKQVRLCIIKIDETKGICLISIRPNIIVEPSKILASDMAYNTKIAIEDSGLVNILFIGDLSQMFINGFGSDMENSCSLVRNSKIKKFVIRSDSFMATTSASLLGFSIVRVVRGMPKVDIVNTFTTLDDCIKIFISEIKEP